MPTLVDPNIIEQLLRQRTGEDTMSPYDFLKQYEYQSHIANRPMSTFDQTMNGLGEANMIQPPAKQGI